MSRRVLIALAAFAASLTFTHAASMLSEDTQGCYTVPAGSKYYKIVNHQLYANAEGQWYVLRAPQLDRGFVRGLPWIVPERWQKVGGSHIVNYARSGWTFINSERAPLMAQNPVGQ